MTLTLEEGRAKVEELEAFIAKSYKPGRATGMWSEGKIAWKINTDKGVVYKSSPDNIGEKGILNMIDQAMVDGPSVSMVDKAIKKVSNFGFRRTEYIEPKKIEIDPELLERAEAQGLFKEIRAGGGERKDENKDRYWLTLEQICDLNDLDDKFGTDDDGFWAAFAEMRETQNIEKIGKAVKWSGNYSNPKNYMYDWWSGSGYKSSSSSSSSEIARRLAVALGVISSTIQVINDKGETWKIQFATDDKPESPKSLTAYDTRDIVVSPQALLDTGVKEMEQIEITTGYGLHEGSHVQYSADLSPQLEKPFILWPISVAGMLLNIIEDVRIEGLTAIKYPGFASYFETMNAYLWNKAVKPNAPKVWGPKLNEKVNAIVAICKWPVEYEPTFGANAALKAEFEWFRLWVTEYIDGKVNARDTVKRGLDHLREDPETEKEMKELEKKEQKTLAEMKAFGEAVKKAIEDFKAGKTSLEPCPSPAGTGKATIDPKTGAEVDKLVREKFEINKITEPAKMPGGYAGGGPQTAVQKPEIPPAGLKDPIRSPLMDRLKSAFKLRKAKPMYSNRLLKSGALDDEEMWRVLGNDFRVFEQRVIEEDPDTQVTLLVDASGSMRGANIEKASALSAVLLDCLRDMKGVRVRVRAHTSENSDGLRNTNHIFRIWEPGDPINRIGLLRKLEMTANYDGFAIAWCAEEMLREARPGEDMLMIVLADGLPSGGQFPYGGPEAERHVRQVVDAYGKKDVTIIQLAISPHVPAAAQERMFGRNYIQYETDEKLPQQLTNLLIRIFGNNE